ncbi:hypothetical protein ACIA5E_30865 [Nocardia asteroides]|uniref:hypothetical protein n=1 Tax=Nocardia asteroides TaxID=1824 RepID=UPI00379865D3
MLVEAGLLRRPVLCLSGYVIITRRQYYRRLRSVTARVEILVALHSRRCDADFGDHRGEDQQFPAAPGERSSREFATVMECCVVSRPTATGWLNGLAEAGMIRDVKIGRDRVFINAEFLHLPTAP